MYTSKWDINVTLLSVARELRLLELYVVCASRQGCDGLRWPPMADPVSCRPLPS